MRLLYVPYRFFQILFITGWICLRYAFSSRTKFPRSHFLKVLFEHLGGTYIKAGQALAMRQDFLSVAQLEALSGLLDEVRPFNAERGVRMIERSFGQPVDAVLGSLDRVPFASASFSQVYRATDKEGNALAIKVKRPHIGHILYADTLFMRIFGRLASIAGPGRKLGVRQLVHEVIEVLESELDYGREMDYMSIMGEAMGEIPGFVVPRVYRGLSGKQVIVMDYLDGISLKEIFSRKRAGEQEIEGPDGKLLDLSALGNLIYEISMRSIFEMGFFHADPHPGNILVLSDQRIGFVDYGIVGYLSQEARNLNFSYMDALARGDMDEAADIYTRIVVPNADANFEGLKREMAVQLRVWRAATANPEAGFAEKSSGTVLNNSINLARKHSFHLPRNTVLYYKTIMTIDHINIELNPAYDSIADAEAFVQDYSLRRMQTAFNQTDWMSMFRKFNENLDQATDLFDQLDEFLRERNQQDTERLPLILRRLFGTVSAFSWMAAIAFPVLKYGTEIAFFRDMDPVLCWLLTGICAFSGWHFGRMAR